MSSATSNPAKQVEQAAKSSVRQAAANPWVERLARLGFVVRGVLYVIIGALALQLALGAGGATATPKSAIDLIGRQPLGQFLLIIVALGLTGYALWGFIRAIFDPLHRGSDAHGLLDRAGFFFSGVSYGLLVIPTIYTLLHKPAPAATGGSGSPSLPASLLSGPYGKWVVVAFGLFWIAVGLGQILLGYRARFTRDLKKNTMSAREVETATWLGRLGYAARGVVFGVIGLIIIRTSLTAGTRQTPGFDAALAALAHAPYGQALLAVVALGLIFFGLYSILCAKWMRVGVRRTGA
jgi:hypothetical protein